MPCLLPSTSPHVASPPRPTSPAGGAPISSLARSRCCRPTTASHPRASSAHLTCCPPGATSHHCSLLGAHQQQAPASPARPTSLANNRRGRSPIPSRGNSNGRPNPRHASVHSALELLCCQVVI